MAQNYYQKEIETMPIEDMKKLQSEKLVKQVKHVYENVPYYKNLMDEKGVKPEDIKGIDDLHKLPFSYKQDLRDYYPWGMLSAPLSDIVRIHASSGTTGKPIVAGYTQNDLKVWEEVGARCLAAFGMDKNDVFHVSYGYGLFTGGLGAHYGVENLGATVIPTSTGNTEKHLKLLRDLNVTVIACTPSYAL